MDTLGLAAAVVLASQLAAPPATQSAATEQVDNDRADSLTVGGRDTSDVESAPANSDTGWRADEAPLSHGEANNETVPAANNVRPSTKPSDVWRGLPMPDVELPLKGRATSLATALRGAIDREQQTDRAIAYWNLASAVTNYHLSLRERDELERLLAALGARGARSQWALSAASARVSAAQRHAVAQQLELHRLMEMQVAESLPLPSSEPHCGPYQTRFAEQSLPDEFVRAASRLHQLLPLRRSEVLSLARTVVLAEQVLDETPLASVGVDGMLNMHGELAAARRAFVSAVHQYNCDIARYTRFAKPDPVDTERLVGMLIRTTRRADMLNDESVAPATATERFDQSPRTFRTDDSFEADSGVREPAGPPPFGTERSILKRRP